MLPVMFKGSMLDILSVVLAGLPTDLPEYQVVYDYFLGGLERGIFPDTVEGFYQAEAAFYKKTLVSKLYWTKGEMKVRELNEEETLKRKAAHLFEAGCSNVLREFHNLPRLKWN